MDFWKSALKRLREQVKNHSVINNLTQHSPLSFENLRNYQSDINIGWGSLLHIFLCCTEYNTLNTWNENRRQHIVFDTTCSKETFLIDWTLVLDLVFYAVNCLSATFWNRILLLGSFRQFRAQRKKNQLDFLLATFESDSFKFSSAILF